MKVTEVVDALKACQSLEQVSAMDLSKDPRAGVQKALAKRIEELTPDGAALPEESKPVLGLRVLTQENLDKNPEFVSEGLKVGDNMLVDTADWDLSESADYKVAEQDLESYPELVKAGIKVGDVIKIVNPKDVPSAPESKKPAAIGMTVPKVEIEIKKCKTIQELNALGLSKDPRVGVQVAVSRRMNELQAELEPTNAATPAEPVPSTYAGMAYSGDKAGEAAPVLTPMQQKVEEFKGKIRMGCRWTSIIDTAELFFGKDLKSAQKIDGTFDVRIILKDKEKTTFDMKGL